MADIHRSAAIFFIFIRPGRIKDVSGITVQSDCSEVSGTGAKIIFIEKRRSFPVN